MTATRFILTLRLYGAKGVRDWFLRLFSKKTDPLLAELQLHVKAKTIPERGITLIGDFSGTNSLSKVMRDLAQSLKQAAIPFQTLDLAKPIPSDFVFNRYSDIIGMFSDYPVNGMSGCRQHRIIFWEFDSGFAEIHPQLVDGSPILALSDYCSRSLRQQIHPSTPIRQIRYPFHFDAEGILPSDAIRAKYGIPAKSLMVFFNFDYRSSYYRKNPEGLLAAFIEALGNEHDAVLVFKTNGRNANSRLASRLEQIATASAVGTRVFFINDYISEKDLVALTASCDVYASLHRGEGFGLGIAEAMSLGKAVVATAHGANLEFCNSTNSELVPYEIVGVRPDQHDLPVYKYVTRWADPDIHAAARALRKLYENPDYRDTIGSRAKSFIREFYSIENFKKSMASFFNPA